MARRGESVFPCVWLDGKGVVTEKWLPKLGCAENIVTDLVASACCVLLVISFLLIGFGSAYIGSSDRSGAAIATVVVGVIMLVVVGAPLTVYYVIRAVRMFRVQEPGGGVDSAADAERGASGVKPEVDAAAAGVVAGAVAAYAEEPSVAAPSLAAAAHAE